jgi:mandelate racemase
MTTTASAAARLAPQLTVRGLLVRAVDVPLKRPLHTAGGTVASAPLVLVDLQTEEGITGVGYIFTYTTLALRPTALLTQALAPLIVGKPLAPLALAATLGRAFRLLGPQGLTGMSMAAIDMAAWDAVARANGLPLARLLGGEPRPIQAYASLGLLPAEHAVQDVQAAVADGFSAAKIRLGFPELRQDLEVVRAVRRTVGDEMVLMADYNQALTVPEAIHRIRALDGEGLTWIEEPTRADDFAGHAEISRQVATPIQIGENWWGVHDAARSLAAGASDYVMLDAMKIGGVTGWLAAAALSEAAGKPASNHLFVEVSAQLLAVTPTCHWLEYLDLAGPILEQPGRPVDGRLMPADRPGSGIEWNEEAVSRLLID